MQDIIKRPSLGRTAFIGDYYDIRTEQIIPGMSIFKKDIKPHVRIEPNFNQKKMTHTFASSTTEKLNELNIHGDVKLSLLSDLLPNISGAAKFIYNDNLTKNDCQCHFIQQVTTKNESINICDENLQNCFDDNIIDLATHFIVKINYGANATATLTYETDDKQKKKDIEGNITAGIGELANFATIGSSTSAKYEVLNLSSLKNLRFEYNADFQANEQTPRTPEEALDIICHLPGHIKDDGQGRQLEFELLPLSVLKKRLNFDTTNSFTMVQPPITKRIEYAFDNIEKSKLELNSLKKFQDTYKFDIDVLEFQHKMATLLKETRSCAKNQSSKDILIINDYITHSLATPEAVEMFVETFEPMKRRINHINEALMAKTILPEFTLKISFIENVDEIINLKFSTPSGITIYMFSYCYSKSFRSKEWAKHYRYFRNIYSQKKELCILEKKLSSIFVMVDFDIVPALQEIEELSNDPCISIIANGNYYSKEVVDNVIDASTIASYDFNEDATEYSPISFYWLKKVDPRINMLGIDVGTTKTVVVNWLKGQKPTFVTTIHNEYPDFKDNSARTVIGFMQRLTTVLEKIRDDAKRQTGVALDDVIISVPAYFGHKQRNAIFEVAKEADLNILQLEPESIAAAYAYMYYKVHDDDYDLFIVNLGGGTLDTTVVSIKDLYFQIKATGVDKDLGGNDFTEILMKLIKRKLREKNVKNFENAENLIKLRQLAEETKFSFIKSFEEVVNLGDFTQNGEKMDIKITRNEFEELAADLQKRIKNACEKTLLKAKMKAENITKVTLMGGASQMLLVTELLKNLFPHVDYFNDYPYKDETVAYGAIIHAVYLKQRKGSSNDEYSKKWKEFSNDDFSMYLYRPSFNSPFRSRRSILS